MKLQAAALMFVLAFLFHPIQAQEGENKAPQQPPAQDRGSDRDRGNRQEPGWRQQQPQEDNYTRPIFLTGSVELSDGSPVPESVRVSLICNNNVVDQTFTHLDGQFSFQLGDHRPTTVMDASASGAGFGGFGGMGGSPPFGQTGQLGGSRSAGMGRIDMSNCEIQAALPGFVSDMLRLGVRSVLDNPDVGTIVLHRSEKTPGTTVSLTTLAAPKDASKAYEKARKELSKEKPNVKNAAKELEKAVEVYPEFSAAWYLLGNLRKDSSDLEGARDAYQKAVVNDNQYLPPYLGLAEISLQENNLEAVEQYSQEVLKLNPTITVAHYFNAVANYFTGEMEPAEESLKTIKATPGEADRFPMTYYMMGVIEANRGNYNEAAADLERLLEIQPEFPAADDVEKQLEEWETAGLIKRSDSQSEQETQEQDEK